MSDPQDQARSGVTDTGTANVPAALYEQLGGQARIDEIVERFYDRVVNDPRLAPFFITVSMDRLRHMQSEFFALALGGSAEYSGRQIADAHAEVPITPEDFSRYANHLLDTLEDLGYDKTLVDAVVDRISLYADDVLGGFGEEG